MRGWALALLGAPLVTSPALAGEPTAYQAILAGQLGPAENALVAERQAVPAAPELMLNLAAVYLKTGRSEEARTLYAKILARPAMAMDMPSGAVVSSHDVARLGLARLKANAIVQR